jgi:hypothetical protein
MESFPCAKPARLWQKGSAKVQAKPSNILRKYRKICRRYHCEYNNSLVLVVLNSLRP